MNVLSAALRAPLALFALLLPGLWPLARAADETQAVENLAAFARVYGYVRFFHPSDEAAAADWDKIAIVGAEAVRDGRHAAQLRTALLEVFGPLAPTLRLTEDRAAAPPSAAAAPSAGPRLIFWRYEGIKLSDQPGPYHQQRVFSDQVPGAPEALTVAVAPDIVLRLPLALPVSRNGRTAANPTGTSAALARKLAALDLKALTPADWRLRVAGVITVWNVFQHFHPYLDLAGVKWDEALRPALRRALADRDGTDYRATLLELIAKTGDGHGFLYGPPLPLGGLPIRVERIEEQLAITATAGDSPFRKGDLLTRIDGVPALEILRERERYTPGSPHLREFRALNQFGEGPLGSTARVELVRESMPQTIEFVRGPDRRFYFVNPIAEFDPPAFAEVRPGIFYVNLHRIDAGVFRSKLAQLAKARGVIVDERVGGGVMTGKAERLAPEIDIIPHLIDQTVQASPMLVPQITRPDRAGWSYHERTWPVAPKSPRFTSRVVFINEPSVVSYGETCMAMIADYGLARLVGAPTAGCNGNVNFIPLPGGFRVMWTGMDVRKHDRSSFYGVGFVPDFPVTRTLRAMREGRDEYLEKAIAVIEAAGK